VLVVPDSPAARIPILRFSPRRKGTAARSAFDFATGFSEEAAVKHPFPTPVNPDVNNLMPLAERLDPAIGEATSVMGALLTELIRRSLRGGVTQIGEQLNTYVCERVDATIVERTPAIEQAAVEVADNTARAAATEVAKEEVTVFAKRTEENFDQLGRKAEETSRQLVAQIEETERKARDLTGEVSRDLTGRINTVEKKAEETTETKARALAQQIEEAERKAHETTEAKARDLLSQILEAEKRAGVAASQQVQELVLRSRKGTAMLKARIGEVRSEATTAADALRRELAHLREENQKLAARVVELEKPRGLRALWHWFVNLFRGKKRAEEAEPALVEQ
jgi:hypothetical protein